MGVFEKAIIQGEDIFAYIPQRPPMVMVDSYYGKSSDSAYTGLTIDGNSLFCDDGVFQEAGIIEHIAQSAAVSVGVGFVERGESVPIGFIGAVSKFKINRLPKSGEILHTTTKLINNYMEVSLVFSEVKVGEELVASGELKIFLDIKSDDNI